MRTNAILPSLAAVLALVAGTAEARVHVRTTLTPTTLDADASGRARLNVGASSDGRFELVVRGLDRATSYDLVVAGVRVATIVTNDRGRARVRFRTRPRGSDLPLGFDPRGAAVVVRGASGGDVLVATIPQVADRNDTGDLVCCIPDDSGPECEDRTQAECDAQGGTVVPGATSCLPNPCAGATPVADEADVVCCLPDDSGPECEDRTQAECLAGGGVVVSATSCVPEPCAPMAPGDGGGAGTPALRVTCERRANRSKVSVDGSNLAAGTYQARVLSGGQSATAGPAPTVGDEVEFDFDSQPDDVAAGATAIAAAFIAGDPPQVTGQILDVAGTVLVESTVDCAQL
jgi:hypothetical protein